MVLAIEVFKLSLKKKKEQDRKQDNAPFGVGGVQVVGELVVKDQTGEVGVPAG